LGSEADQELTPAEAAVLLGVNERTVKIRWLPRLRTIP
jgi:hypothetical protein